MPPDLVLQESSSGLKDRTIIQTYGLNFCGESRHLNSRPLLTALPFNHRRDAPFTAIGRLIPPSPTNRMIQSIRTITSRQDS